MDKIADWDWSTGDKRIANIEEWLKRFHVVHEFAVTNDGEQIAAIVEEGNKRVTPCVNGRCWPETFERAWSLRFSPDDRLVCFGLRDYEWSVSVDAHSWEESYDYIWNLTFSNDGQDIAVNAKKDGEFGIALNGRLWDTRFPDARDVAISPDGSRTASRVKTKRVATLDIFTFAEGVLTIAVDGKAWDKGFLGIWGMAFSADSQHVAAGVKLDHLTFTVAVDGTPWEQTFLQTWEPIFNPKTLNAISPVKFSEGWTLAMDGKPFWEHRYVQLWGQKFSPDGRRIAAVVAPEFGRWTISLDDLSWVRTFSDAVLTPVFSPDSSRVAAVVKENNRYTIAVDGIPWSTDFDMIWEPVFSPDGNKVAAKAEINGKYMLVVDGKTGVHLSDELWDPIFSPDSRQILIRCIENGWYHRKVLPLDEI
jgi:hypothetical protein